MKSLFVVGTDTGVGKTIVTGCLARFLAERGFSVITQKWIETGSSLGVSLDIKLHLKIMRKDIEEIKEDLRDVSPYIFKHPSSPHLASKRENKRLAINKIIKSFRVLAKKFDFVVVEGIGGALVPIDEKHLVVDIVRRLHLPVLVVAQNKLGAINHTLLTTEALTVRGVEILGIVFNNLKKEDRRILKDNPRIIKGFSGERILGILPREISYNKLYKRFVPIGEKILRLL